MRTSPSYWLYERMASAGATGGARESAPTGANHRYVAGPNAARSAGGPSLGLAPPRLGQSSGTSGT